MKDEIDELAKLMANRIGSPWGEGATYSHERAETSEKPKENGRLNSHLDDEDFELFVSDLKQAILALKKKWEQEAKTEERYKTKYEILSKISSMHLTVDRQAFGENYTCDIMPYISKKLSYQLNGDK